MGSAEASPYSSMLKRTRSSEVTYDFPHPTRLDPVGMRHALGAWREPAKGVG